MSPSVSEIKKAQKEALLFREIANLYNLTAIDDPRLNGIFITKVELSDNKGLASVYFYTDLGEKHFRDVLSTLILYKPSLRKALSQKIMGRYTPEIAFKFDDKFEKQTRLESLLDKIKE